jgi:hypothetical protein
VEAEPVTLPETIDLVDGFQYVHEPLLDDSGPIPFLGEQGAIAGLRDRIRNSRGGLVPRHGVPRRRQDDRRAAHA